VTEPQRGAQYAPLAVLVGSAFVSVTAETLPIGLLPQIAHGLDVPEAHVGMLVVSYAAVAAVTTIPLTAMTLRVPRDRLIAAVVAIFAISQFAAALAPTFQVLVLTRLLCALAHGVFWSTIAPAAARLAPPGRAGRATSFIFLGNSLAQVLGVPFGTALGQLLGWRMAIAVLALVATLCLTAVLAVLPDLPALSEDLATRTATRLRAATSIIRSRAIMPVSVITMVLVIGHFAAYTYIAPLVRRDGDLQGLGLSALLLGFGAAGLMSNLLVGRFVDRRPGAVLAGTVAVITLSLVVLAMVPGPIVTVIVVLAWGAAYIMVPVSLQAAILRVAPQSADAASAVYVVAFQIGIGTGALSGEHLINAGRIGDLPILGAALALAAGVIVLCARRTFPFRIAMERPVVRVPVERPVPVAVAPLNRSSLLAPPVSWAFPTPSMAPSIVPSYQPLPAGLAFLAPPPRAPRPAPPAPSDAAIFHWEVWRQGMGQVR
jgi:predicted MFS family arabinose efflux permease